MTMMAKATKAVTDRMPKVISPGMHALIDYVSAASFLGAAALFWGNNKRAAISSLTCGAAQLSLALLTDYPGGVWRQASFETHGRIDVGLAAVVGTLPDYMGFDDEKQSAFFRMKAIELAAVTGLTDFTRTGRRRQLRELDERAA